MLASDLPNSSNNIIAIRGVIYGKTIRVGIREICNDKSNTTSFSSTCGAVCNADSVGSGIIQG